jgi:hypothetical protein
VLRLIRLRRPHSATGPLATSARATLVDTVRAELLSPEYPGQSTVCWLVWNRDGSMGVLMYISTCHRT